MSNPRNAQEAFALALSGIEGYADAFPVVAPPGGIDRAAARAHMAGAYVNQFPQWLRQVGGELFILSS
jgi:hypothetical protein